MRKIRGSLVLDPAPCVYFVQEGSGGPIKIGFTKRGLYQRLEKLQEAAAGVLNVRGVIHDADPQILEYALHEMFAEYRLDGEWFLPSKAILDYISKNAVEVHYTTCSGFSARERLTCEVCREKESVTADGRLCRGCLRRWANSETPGISSRRSRKNDCRVDFEQNPSFENAVRRIEDSSD